MSKSFDMQDYDVVVCEKATKADRMARESVCVDPAQLKDDHTDYSRVVVRKPWGYEYLIYNNPFVAVWILHIKSNAQTSMHCHSSKTTSLVVLHGKAQCLTLEDSYYRGAGQAIRLGVGVFHRTKALGDNGIFVMEVESPVNKRDLIRVQDDYGREAKAYESSDWLARDLENFNYFSAIDDAAYYNTRKYFGNSGLVFRSLCSSEKIRPSNTMLVLLSGSVKTDDDSFDEPGQIFCAGNLLEAGRNGAQLIEVTRANVGIRTSESIVAQLCEHGVENIFFVPDSVNAHLVDALVRDTRMRSFAFDSERAACLAAEGYAKASGKPGVLFVSSGAASLNAMNGVANAWVDSCPLVIISSQSLTSENAALGGERLRQAANKSLNIADIISPITKTAELVRVSRDVHNAVDRVLRVATEERPGPCWLDIPIDVLGGEISPSEYEGKVLKTSEPHAIKCCQRDLAKFRELLTGAKRPVLLAGYGVRGSGAVSDFRTWTKQLRIPVLLTRRGMDLLAHNDPWNFGVPGAYGQRGANFILQNADLLICIGARLSRPLTGRTPENFAPLATKVIIEIDARELEKPIAKLGLSICADAGEFCRAAIEEVISGNQKDIQPWLVKAREWRDKYPAGGEAQPPDSSEVDPIRWIAMLSTLLKENELISVESGFVLDCFIHGFHSKSGQIVLSSSGLESSGFAIPAAIGASVAVQGREVVVLTDTLGFNSSLGELRTIAVRKIPLKILVFDAPANLTVRRVQELYFGKRFVPSPLFETWTEQSVALIAKYCW